MELSTDMRRFFLSDMRSRRQFGPMTNSGPVPHRRPSGACGAIGVGTPPPTGPSRGAPIPARGSRKQLMFVRLLQKRKLKSKEFTREPENRRVNIEGKSMGKDKQMGNDVRQKRV